MYLKMLKKLFLDTFFLYVRSSMGILPGFQLYFEGEYTPVGYLTPPELLLFPVVKACLSETCIFFCIFKSV